MNIVTLCTSKEQSNREHKANLNEETIVCLLDVRQVKLMQISWTIQPGQRLTTGPEQNFACREVTNCVKPEGWRVIGHNASEGIQPRNVHRRRRAKGFMSWKPAAWYAIW